MITQFHWPPLITIHRVNHTYLMVDNSTYPWCIEVVRGNEQPRSTLMVIWPVGCFNPQPNGQIDCHPSWNWSSQLGLKTKKGQWSMLNESGLMNHQPEQGTPWMVNKWVDGSPWLIGLKACNHQLNWFGHQTSWCTSQIRAEPYPQSACRLRLAAHFLVTLLWKCEPSAVHSREWCLLWCPSKRH